MTDSSVTGRNQNHSDVRDESARDNDPLFELSRIFGFDEPADQKNNYAQQPEPEMSSEISLERELMADFDADFAADFAAEPVQPVSQYQPSQETYRPSAPAPVESRAYQPVVEPRFTGYAPQQRAYAPSPAPEESFAISEPAFQQDAPQYYDETPVYAPEPLAAEAAQDSYYQAYSALPQDPAFSEPAQTVADDYFTSLDNELNQNFGADPVSQAAVQSAQLDTPAYDFSEIGREPQQEFAPQTYDTAFADNTSYSAAPQQASASFEDELAFLLQDEAPVAAPVQPAYQPETYAAETYSPKTYGYEEPAFTPAPVVYDEPVVPQTDFAPLFDAPAAEVAPVVADYDDQTVAAQDDYSQTHQPVADYDQIEDEFFAAPDLNHLPNRGAAVNTDWDEGKSDAAAANSFADLFGAGSQSEFAAEEEPSVSYQPEEPVSLQEDQQTDSFIFGDDFYGEQEEDTAFEAAIEPEPVAPLSHNAVRGYSSYTFGAATPAAASAEQSVSQFTERAAPSYPSYDPALASTVAPVAAPVAAPAYSEPAATDDFFSNDDFDFSFDEDIQPADDFSAAEEELPYELPEEPELPAYQPVQSSAPKSFIPAPEIDSVVVSENKVEQTQALDLPEVSYGDDVKETGLNSLESEFAEIFSTISVNEAATADTTSEADKAFENILQDNFADYHASMKNEAETADEDHHAGFGATAGVAAGVAAGLAGAAVAGAALRAGSARQQGDAPATQDDYYNHWAAQGAQNNDFDTYNLSENFSRDEDNYTEVQPRGETAQRKPLLWVSVAAAALIVLGGGYYMLKSGGVVGGEPAVLRADSQPVKVQPENPGGTVVPNQDKAVYEQVSGTKPATPEQKTLINTEEEPVDVGLLAGQDAEEERLMSEDPANSAGTAPAATNNASQEAERELITPRTVKTMIVRADGTLVPGEAPAASREPAPTDNGLDEASRLISQSAVPERLGSEKPASAQSAAAPRVVQTQTFTASGDQVKPREVTTAPVVPSRPAEQPVNVVGNVERPAQQAQNRAMQQVAAAEVPAATAPAANAPAGTWFIQVASQPSAELAQKNYANLTSRYGNIIGGRGVDIKKADIAGKGTYYRVRIPGGTKAEAAALCERLKSAGGSCFPTL